MLLVDKNILNYETCFLIKTFKRQTQKKNLEYKSFKMIMFNLVSFFNKGMLL